MAVVGSGSWGTTLAKILADSGHGGLLWCRRKQLCQQINETHFNMEYLPGAKLPPSVTATVDLRRICDRCRFILLVVPSHGFRQVANQMGEFLTGEHIIVHATKGIEQKTHKRMSEILREETPVRKIGVLSGPNLAGEVAQGQPAGTLVASRDDEVFRCAHRALHNHYFRVYGSHDVIGAEVAGSFKNIVAVAAGAVDGLKLGDNSKALLLTRGINEMARLGVAMGAKVLTFGGMAGIGDLMATCASPLSRNHQVGERLAKGQKVQQILDDMKMVAEGVNSTAAVHSFAERRGLDLPIVRAVHRVLYEDVKVAHVLENLMAIETGDEFRGLSPH